MTDTDTPKKGAGGLTAEQLTELDPAELDRLLAGEILKSPAMEQLADAGEISLAKMGRAAAAVPDPPAKKSTDEPAGNLSIILAEPDAPEGDPDRNDVITDSLDSDTGGGKAGLLAQFHSAPDDGDDGDYGDVDSSPIVPTDDDVDNGPGDFTPTAPAVPEVDTAPAPAAQPNPAPTMPRIADGPAASGDKGSAVSDKLQGALDWVKRQPKSRTIPAAVLVVILVFVLMLTRCGGSDDTAGTTGSGAGAVVVDDNQQAETPDSSGTGSPAPLTDVIDRLTAGTGSGGDCPDPSTPAGLAASGADDEAWVCGRSGNFDGEILNIIFRRSVTVSSLSFTPGFNYVHEPAGDDEWMRHRVITRILVRIGGQQIPAEVIPSRETFTLNFDRPIRTNDGDAKNPPAMSITIQGSVPPSESLGTSSGAGAATPGSSPLSLGAPAGDSAQNAIAMSNLVINGTVN